MDDNAQVVRLQPAYKVQPGHDHVQLCASFAPVSNAVVVAPSASLSRAQSGANAPKQRQVLYQLQHSHESIERRSMYLESYTLFASLQRIALESGRVGQTSSWNLAPVVPAAQPEFVVYTGRICRLLKDIVVKQMPLIEADSSLEPTAKTHSLLHHASLHAILSLSEILYMPFDGSGDGLVGEELLDWVNTVDRAPSAAEGEELADLARPWEHSNFWPYVYRCILRAHILSAAALLSLVESHSSPLLQSVASLATGLLESFPRSTDFREERQFTSKLRGWKVQASAALKQSNGLFEGAESDPILGGAESEDERLDWEAGFKCLFELLAGVETRVLEASEDWREALGAWGVLVNASGRRQDLPATLERILKTHPVDPSLPSEATQVALILGDVPRALQQSNLISGWLVAHLADMLDKLGIIEGDPSFELTLRDYFVLHYSDLLLSDSTMWRIVVEYLSTCGPDGRARMSAVLLNTPLDDARVDRDPSKPDSPSRMDVENSEKENEEPAPKPTVVEEVVRLCVEHGLEDEAASKYSEMLVAQKRFGEAIPFCVRAADFKRIARIGDRILDEYITDGQEAFIHHVDSIPTSILRPQSIDMLGDGTRDGTFTGEQGHAFAPYSARLSFLARYRDFFAFYARGDRRQAAALLVLLLTSNVAPKGFFAVMLLDVLPLLEDDQVLVTLDETYELLRCLEDVTGPINATGHDALGHLDSLARLLGATGHDSVEDKTARAMKQLDVVRHALARHLAVCCTLP